MLSLQHITKRFDGLTALEDVSVTCKPGVVHGVLGENGAGKTTLMRIAAGLIAADAGSVSISDRGLPPGASARAGIAMVHQHFMLVPTLTVVENCLIGRRDEPQFISRRQAAQLVDAIAGHVGLEIDPFAKVETLSVGEQQRVEIVRALIHAGQVLILDEPTAVLAPQETDQLFAAIDSLRQDGMAIVFISHKLGEVERICDELTILRRGRVVYTGVAGTLSQAQMAEYMVGEPIRALRASEGPAASRRGGEGERGGAGDRGTEGQRDGGIEGAEITPALEMVHIHIEDPISRRRLLNVNLVVRSHEILGIAGVEGNGQDVLAAAVVGALHPEHGHILLAGRDVTAESIRARAAAGLAHIAEDRLRQALVPDMSLAENLILKSYRSPAYARGGFLRRRAIDNQAADQMARFDVRAASPAGPARQLSGGNQQKLVLARELSGEPRLIVAHNPTRGLDVAATRFVFEQLLEQRRRGAGILLIHSDLDELLSVSDRVAVLYNGRLTLTDWPACDRATIGQLMLGGAPH